MDIDKDERNGGLVDTRKTGFHLFPVPPNASGEGLPYAPVDWPCPGDKWSWKVGKRTRRCGDYFWDRYLYLPDRLQEKSKRKVFVSKVSVEQYIRSNYPGTDVKAFFNSFSWKIPAKSTSEIKEHSWSGTQRETSGCKAGNKLCSSLIEPGKPASETMFCDICCSETGFCRDCCCILCSKTIDPANESYSFIRCEAAVEESVICGHLAHLYCGLKSNMAGTVGGRVCLDVEYYCRRCDTRTDLLPHVEKFLQICKYIDSHDDINKILKLGARVLHGSLRSDSRRLLHSFESAMGKQHDSRLKTGTVLDEVRNVDDSSASTKGVTYHNRNNAFKSAIDQYEDIGHGSTKKVSENFHPVVESLKLEYDVHQTLRALRKSQEWEYNIAKERLCEQMSCIQNLCQQLEMGKCEIARHLAYVADPDDLLQITKNRVDEIKTELLKLDDMKAVSKGFAKTSKGVMYHNGNNAFESAIDEYEDIGKGSPKKVSEDFDPVVESLKLESDVHRTLRALKKFQEWEYNIAKGRLCEQMSCIQNLYQQLDKEKYEIARHIAYVVDRDGLLQITEDRVDEIKKELLKLEDMKAVSKGFAKSSKEILKQHFGLDM